MRGNEDAGGERRQERIRIDHALVLSRRCPPLVLADLIKFYGVSVFMILVLDDD
jgi:hypothetical protein